VSIFENDRPEGYDEERDGTSKLVPREELPPREKLAMDAHDVEEFIEHFDQEGEPLAGEQGAP
jgi:hypothetical protein